MLEGLSLAPELGPTLATLEGEGVRVGETAAPVGLGGQLCRLRQHLRPCDGEPGVPSTALHNNVSGKSGSHQRQMHHGKRLWGEY